MVDLDHWLSTFVDDLEGEVLGVPLDVSIVKGSTNDSLRVVNSVSGVLWGLVLCGVSNQSLIFCECDP